MSRMRGAVPLQRVAPKAGPENFKTYSMRQPLPTHWRVATCEEVDCVDYLTGFVTTIDTSTEMGKWHYDFITHDKTRSYSMQRVSDTLFKFIYGPGNTCWKQSEHRTLIGKPALFVVTGGDWRGNPRQTPKRVHVRAEDWVDDFASHQDGISQMVRRG
jgi:hypothetical protein